MAARAVLKKVDIVEEPIRIDVRSYVTGGKQNLERNFGLSKEEIQKFIRKSMNRTCHMMRYYARTHHEYKNNPARQQREGVEGLTRAITFQWLNSEKTKAELYIDSPKAPTDGRETDTYGTYQIRGTEAHGAIHKKRLRFFIDRDRAYLDKYHPRWESFSKKHKGHKGIWIMANGVSGIQSDDIFGRTYNKTRARVKEIFDEELGRLLNGK